MAAKTRPYLIVRDGRQHIVDAPNPGAALSFVVRDIVTTCEAASGSAVAKFVAGGGQIEVWGLPPSAPLAPLPNVESSAGVETEPQGADLLQRPVAPEVKDEDGIEYNLDEVIPEHLRGQSAGYISADEVDNYPVEPASPYHREEADKEIEH